MGPLGLMAQLVMGWGQERELLAAMVPVVPGVAPGVLYKRLVLRGQPALGEVVEEAVALIRRMLVLEV